MKSSIFSSAAAPYRQPNFGTSKILVPNLWIGNAISLETPVSSEILSSKLEFRAHFHSQTGVWERAVMRRCLRLSLGNALLRVTSVINEASRIQFEDCYTRRNEVTVEGIEISIISKRDIVKNKESSGRHRDLADIESLREN